MPTVVELRKEAKRLGLRGYSKMKKAELEAAIEEALEDQSSNEEEDEEEHVPTDCISRSKMKLKPHQVQLVEHLKDHRGVVAAFGVGTGKTLTAVAASQCYLDANPTHKVIVVTPVSLQDNFKKELTAYGGDVNDRRYEFITMTKFATKYSDDCPTGKYFLIIDEAHNLRTEIAAARKACERRAAKNEDGEGGVCKADVAVTCARKADKVLLLTATPLYNDPTDLINLVAMVKGTPAISITEFSKMTPEGFCGYFKDTIMFFENEKTNEYPKKTEKIVRIPMTPSYYKQYRAVENQKNHLWKDTSPFLFLTGVRQATNALKDCQKCDWTIKKIQEGQKTLVYSAFLTFGIKKIQESLKALNIPFVEVTGEMKGSDRTKAMNDYNNNKVKVMFITKAGGEGLDLKGTRVVILLEKSWNRATEEQIIGRAERYRSHTHLPASEQNVTVYHLVLAKPAEEDRDTEKERDSADEILEKITLKKEAQNREFIRLLKASSIGSTVACPPPNYKLKEIETTKPGAGKVYYGKLIDIRTLVHRNETYSDSKRLQRLAGEHELSMKSDSKKTELTFSASKKGEVTTIMKTLLKYILERKSQLPEMKWKYQTLEVYVEMAHMKELKKRGRKVRTSKEVKAAKRSPLKKNRQLKIRW